MEVEEVEVAGAVMVEPVPSTFDETSRRVMMPVLVGEPTAGRRMKDHLRWRDDDTPSTLVMDTCCEMTDYYYY